MVIQLQSGPFSFLEDDYDYNNECLSVALSGGTDSALLLYLLCLHAPKSKIVCYSGVEKVRPTTIWYSREIFLEIKQMFPEVNLIFEEFTFDRYSPEVTRKTQEHWDSVEDKSTLPIFNGLRKKLAMRPYIRDIRLKHNVTHTFNGITKNPPIEIQEKFGFTELCEDRRNLNGTEITENAHVIVHEPFVNLNKKDIAEMYRMFGLMETIFPLTQSCTNNHNNTNYFTEPCKKCYWCYEKMWAFGSYDVCGSA